MVALMSHGTGSWPMAMGQGSSSTRVLSSLLPLSSCVPFIRAGKEIRFAAFPIVSAKKRVPFPAFYFPVFRVPKEVKVSADCEETNPYQSKTAHVKFVLQRACEFGEQFLIVGDDPMLGSWDPSSAVPLEWSDGHVWTAELDVPVGRTVQFKFILRTVLGQLNWQAGPDRSFKVWETSKTIVVDEEWEDAEKQVISEQESSAALEEEAIFIGSKTGSHVSYSNDFNKKTIDDEKPRMDHVEKPSILEEGLVLVPGLINFPMFNPVEAEDCNLPPAKQKQGDVELPMRNFPKEHTHHDHADDDEDDHSDNDDDHQSFTKITKSEDVLVEENGQTDIVQNNFHWLKKIMFNLGFDT